MKLPVERRGFALIAVLWMLVALGVVAVEFHASGSADRGVTANLRSWTRARWSAHAGLAKTLDSLGGILASDSAGLVLQSRSPVLLSPPDDLHEGVRVRVLVRDTRAFLSLNALEATELARLATAVGVDPEPAYLLAAALEGWRGEHGDSARLEAVAELASLPGVSADALARVAPYLHVSGDGRVNVNTAPPPVLVALLGVDGPAAELLVSRRRRLPFDNVYDLVNVLPRLDRSQLQAEAARLGDRISFSPREVEVVVRARPEGSPVEVGVYATVQILGGGRLAVLDLVER